MTVIHKIELFSSKTCPPCVWVKAKFAEKGTIHTEIDADNNPEEFERAIRITGRTMKPQILVHKEIDGEKFIDSIVGMQPARIAAIA